MVLLIGIALGLAFNAETVMKSYSQPTSIPTPTQGSQGVVPQQQQQQPTALSPQQIQQLDNIFKGLLQKKENVQQQQQQIQQQIQQQPQQQPQQQLQLQQLQQQIQQLQRQLEQLQPKEEGVAPLTPAQQQQQQQLIQQQQQQLQQVQQQANQGFSSFMDKIRAKFQQQQQQSPTTTTTPQQQSPTTTTTPLMKFKVKVDSVRVHDDRDTPGFTTGEWRLYLDSNAQRVKVDRCDANNRCAMWYADGGKTATFPNLFIDVSIPTTNGVISIDTLGEEVDGGDSTIPPIPPEAKVAFAAGAAAITGSPEAAQAGKYLDQARSIANKLFSLNGNDVLGTISKQHTQADNYGVGTHAEKSSRGDYTLTYTISKIS